jgi:hypothetical protein
MRACLAKATYLVRGLLPQTLCLARGSRNETGAIQVYKSAKSLIITAASDESFPLHPWYNRRFPLLADHYGRFLQ